MTNPSPLSPAAQAVLDAYYTEADLRDRVVTDCEMLAAALRAATELLSKEVDAPKVDGSKYAGIWHSFDYLNAIANELNGTQPTSKSD
jgi:hypothetical protein